MSRLKKYARKSDLLKVEIKYGSETFKFNLFEEIIIEKENLNKELHDQPSSYSFLTMLHKKLIAKKADLESKKNRAYAKAYIKNKTQNDPSTGRATAKELAKEKAQVDKKFIQAEDAYNTSIHDLGVIESCVRSFEQRKDILQTLSANYRNER